MKELALICGLSSGLVGLMSALALLRAGKPLPSEMQSWKGQSDPEKQFRTNAEWWNRAGLIGLVVAFAFSAASTMAGYYG